MSQENIKGSKSEPAQSDLIDQLKREILELEGTEDSDSTVEDVGLEKLLYSATTISRPVVNQAVDRLLAAGEGLEPTVRKKLVDAAKRGLAAHRPQKLQRFLELERQAQEVGVPDLAATLGISEADLEQMESGQASLLKLGPAQVVAWVRSLNVAAAEAIVSLEHSLGAAPAEVSYAQGSRLHRQLSKEEEDFIDEVRTRLSEAEK